MSDHTRVPCFPPNLEDYAPWVSTYGLLAPYGYCQCGCGQKTRLAPKTRRMDGWAKGQPMRCVHHHSIKYQQSPIAGTKLCPICKEIKSQSEFYPVKTGKRAGRLESRCKECCARRHKSYRETDPDCRAKEQERRNNLSEEAKQRRSELGAVYRVKNLDRYREYERRAKSKYPERCRAREAVRYAVVCEIFPPASSMVCEYCQEAQAAEWHHHRGYEVAYELDVVALCRVCHGKTRQKT